MQASDGIIAVTLFGNVPRTWKQQLSAPTVPASCDGESVIACSVVESGTVKVALPEMLPCVAVMVAIPGASANANPISITVATDVLDEVHVTNVVMFWLVASEYVPEAVN